jgi:hypothetical protein
MKTKSDQAQDFNTTLWIGVAVAALLALLLLAIVYGCMESNQSSGGKPHAAVEHQRALVLTSNYQLTNLPNYQIAGQATALGPSRKMTHNDPNCFVPAFPG